MAAKTPRAKRKPKNSARSAPKRPAAVSKAAASKPAKVKAPAASIASSPLAAMSKGLVCECVGTTIVAINEAGKTMLGYTGKGTAVGRAFHQHVNGAWSKKLSRSLAALTAGKQPKTMTLLAYDGRTLEVDVAATSAGGSGAKARTLMLAVPSSHNRDKVDAVLNDERKFQRLAETGAEAICLIDDGGIIHVNAAGRALFSVAEDCDIIAKSFTEFIHSDYAPHFKRGLKDLIALADAAKPELLKLKDVQGRVIDAEVWLRSLGPMGPYAVLVRDVTQRVIAVETLRSDGKRLQAIVDAVADGVISVDERGLIQSVNAAVERLFGYKPKQLIDKELTKILPQWTDEKGVVVTKSVLGRESIEFPAEMLGQTRDVYGIRHDNTSFPAEITVTTMQHGQGSLFTVVVRDASARRAAEEAQRNYAAKLAGEVDARTKEIRDLSLRNRQILESASDGIIAVDTEGRITTANPAAGELFDRSAAAMTGLPIERVFLYGSGHAKAGLPVPMKAQLAEGPFHTDIEANLARTDGLSFDASYVISPITANRQTMGYVITIRDVTEKKRIAAEQRVAAAVFEQSAEGLFVTDARNRVLKINPAFQRITELSSADVFGRALGELPFIDAKLFAEQTAVLQNAAHAEWEQWTSDKTGKRHAWRVGLSVIRDDQGRPQQYTGIVSDITARKLEEEKMIYQANYDQLTGLPNRTLFNDRLQRVVLEGRRGKTNVGLMFIDLDGFKAINDNLGHDAGDLLLKATAERLLKSVRESDTVARLGGDEFTVIMPLLDSMEGATLVASRILKSLTTPFDLNGQEGRVSASIGISMFPGQAGDSQMLLHNADVAMYHAKRHGKANYQIWRQELEADAEARY
ncbi:MAG: PAS domain S-box protein [Rhodospirillaceae bacterium]|nr:PAS domain S-box protein [Rhodospirillaceae bacterium]